MRYQLNLKPHSLVWTGNYERKNQRLLLTGLKGSLRWWYETLIRGLGFFACDPTADGKCSVEGLSKDEEIILRDAKSEAERAAALGRMIKPHLCAACYLFGCTGWQARFQMQHSCHTHISHAGNGASFSGKSTTLQKGQIVTIPIFARWPLPLEQAEVAMLQLLCAFISKHGSLCARNVLKPSEIDKKNKDSYKSHVNYGLCWLDFKVVSSTTMTNKQNINPSKTVQEFLLKFLGKPHFIKKEIYDTWPDFRYVWYTDTIMHRIIINELVQRDTVVKGNYLSTSNQKHKWLGGTPGVSKKIFSFHANDLCDLKQARTWGYSKADDQFKKWFISEMSTQNINPTWGEAYLQKKGFIDG